MPTRALLVIPTLNEVAHIAEVLDQLLDTPNDSVQLQVVVADGGSQDDTCQLVSQLARRDARVRLLHNSARIQSAAVNLAVRRYGEENDVLIRCDAHADYPPRFCARLVETLERTQADAVVVPLDSRGETPLQKAIAWVSNSPVGTGGSAHRAGTQSGFVDHGHHAAFRLRSFRSAGGYDQSFTHNEDAELDCRQRALGARIYLDAELRVGYSPRKTLAALYRQYFKYGEGRSRTVRRHPHSLRLRQLAVPGHLALSLMAVLAAPWLPWGLLWPALYLATLTAVSGKLAIEHRSPYGLLGVAAAVTMHTAWALGFFTGLVAHRERLWARHMAVPLRLRPTTGDVS
jgi:succinoglycan biosynthesis protein ExoA